MWVLQKHLESWSWSSGNLPLRCDVLPFTLRYGMVHPTASLTAMPTPSQVACRRPAQKDFNLSHTSLPDRHLRTFCFLHFPKLTRLTV
jgi:hypothetical protein